MTDEQKARVAEALTGGVEKLVAWVERAGGFAEEQAPLVAREIINAGLVTEGGDVVLALMVVGAIVLFSWYLKRQSVKHTGDPCVLCERRADNCDRSGLKDASLVALVGAGVVVCIGIQEASELIRIVVAPRLYVLEQLRAML